MEHCVLIAGLPRSGSTLTCHLLNQAANTVALHEPMLVGKLKTQSRDAILQEIERFLVDSRATLLGENRAWSKHIDNKIPTNPVRAHWDGALRPAANERGFIRFDNQIAPDFTLVMKHNELFAALLPVLRERFRIVATIRNPLATLSSWNTVDMKIRTGGAPIARLFDPHLQDRILAASDVHERQLVMLDWYFTRFVTYLPPDHLLKYEDTIATGGRSLSIVSPGAAQLPGGLASYNEAGRYGALMQALAPRLLDSDGAYWKVYRKQDVIDLIGSAS